MMKMTTWNDPAVRVPDTTERTTVIQVSDVTFLEIAKHARYFISDVG